MIMKNRKLIGEEKGMNIAALAAMRERGGDHSGAYKLWVDSMRYPCNELNSTWRQCRANYCEYHALIEHTRTGTTQAKAPGNRFGRPSRLSDEQKKSVLERLSMGITVSAVARELRTTRQTIHRVKAASSV
ncbi:ANR family transcriptional regulator [Kluyvera intermedia]|uniref:ANR family transcriptional regulator n=1 Tax=Kluyvera intermedia TaxID=61648 RepID=UPI0035243DC4